MSDFDPATYPPSAPIALDSVPTWMSTRPCMSKWSIVPRPFLPNTPLACASSTIMMQPYSSASAQSSGSAPRSPSMLKTPSVMSSLRCDAGRSFRIFRAASTSLCGNTLIAARLSRQPSMMLA